MLGVLRFGDEAARLLGEMSSPPGTGIDNPSDAPEARARAAARTRLLLVLRSDGSLRGEERRTADRRKVQARSLRRRKRCDWSRGDAGVAPTASFRAGLELSFCGAVAPLSWTPDHCAEEVSRWQKAVPLMHRSTVARTGRSLDWRRTAVSPDTGTSPAVRATHASPLLSAAQAPRGVPVFDELPDAAGALAAMRHRERFPHERR